MRKNVHRLARQRDGFLAGRRTEYQSYAVEDDDYNDLRAARFSQMFEVFPMNDLQRGIQQDQRTGYTVNGLELRVKLNLRGWDAAQTSDIRKSYDSLSLEGIDAARDYLFQLNRAGVSLGAGTSVGTTEGVELGAEAVVVDTAYTSRTISCSAANGGIQLVDGRHSQQPKYYGQLYIASSNQITSKNELVKQTTFSQYRILIIKTWDLVMDALLLDNDIIKYFLDDPTDVPDLYGPVYLTKSHQVPGNDPDEFADINTRVGHLNLNRIPLTAPLLEKVFRQVDILYDKIVTLDANKPYFTLDEVWKLNETVRWLDDDHYPIENSIFMIIYDNPASRLNPRTYTEKVVVGDDVHSYKPQANICHYELCSEFYYTQPIN